MRDRAVAAVVLGATAFAIAPRTARADTDSETPPSPTTGRPVEPPPPPPDPAVTADSLFNPWAIGNVSGADPIFTLIPGRLDDRSPRVDAKNVVRDPDLVLTNNTDTSGDARIHDIVVNKIGAPRTAELVAQVLAERYGPFTAANSEANRRAIIENLRWIADSNTGVVYNDDRVKGDDWTTQSPNTTLSTRSGVCRDTHTAIAAVLASLVSAHKENGKWVPGSPNGQERNVQVIGFDNPSEYHAYMVFRDPRTQTWSALEYGSSYDLGSPNAVDAFRSLPGYVGGIQHFRLNGWDGKPFLADSHAVAAAEARAFLEDDPGVGQAHETRLEGGPNGGKLTHFITPHLAVVGAIAPSENGALDGGLKLNYHRDLKGLDGRGWLRAGVGVYTSAFDAAKDTGVRGAQGRVGYRTYILGAKIDGRYEHSPYKLLGEHLKLSFGADADLMLGVPLATGPDAETLMRGAMIDLSTAKVGADGILLGHEKLSDGLAFDWALRARYQPDLLIAPGEIQGSDYSSARSIGADALRADFAMALTYRGSALTTRLEAGGSLWAEPFDPAITPSAVHHAVFTVSPNSGRASFAVVAKGEVLDDKLVPVDGIGVALRLHPTTDLEIGAGAMTTIDDCGPRTEVRGSLALKF